MQTFVLIGLHGSQPALIDEVDAGISYEVLPHMWTSLRAVANNEGSQLFCTTHSWECVQAAFLAFRERDAVDDLRIHRLQRSGDDIVAVTHESDLIEAAVMDRVEVR